SACVSSARPRRSSRRAWAGSATVVEPTPSVTRAIVRLPVVDSTQRVAFALAEAGASDRTVVVADTQTAGRGRRGRLWRGEPGTSGPPPVPVRPRLARSRLPPPPPAPAASPRPAAA